MTEFVPFPKIGRLNREVIITEKLDGTNAQIHIDDTGTVLMCGSRTRWIRPEEDNFGFATWAMANRDELLRLGPGSHFGEWYGAGIQRRYGLDHKRFALFNVSRWSDDATRPACCEVVPLLWRGFFEDMPLDRVLDDLRTGGSHAAPGFMQPEGIVVFHTATGTLFKKTLDKDEQPKGRGSSE